MRDDLLLSVEFGIDLVVVNNSIGEKIFDTTMSGLDGLQLPRGNVRVCNRENIGRSFGGYSFAWERFNSDYDFFCFTEDDIGLTSNTVLYQVALELRQNDNLGYVALQGISKEFFGKTSPNQYFAHGGVCMVRQDVLDEVSKISGGLPYSRDPERQDYESIIIDGEVNFTDSIRALGYEGISWNELNHDIAEMPYTYWYDYLRSVRFDQQPSPTKLLFWHVKNFREVIYRLRRNG